MNKFHWAWCGFVVGVLFTTGVIVLSEAMA